MHSAPLNSVIHYYNIGLNFVLHKCWRCVNSLPQHPTHVKHSYLNDHDRCLWYTRTNALPTMHGTTTSPAVEAEALRPPLLPPTTPLLAALSTSILGAELIDAVSKVEAHTIQPIFSQLERSSLKVPEGCLTFLEL